MQAGRVRGSVMWPHCCTQAPGRPTKHLLCVCVGTGLSQAAKSAGKSHRTGYLEAFTETHLPCASTLAHALDPSFHTKRTARSMGARLRLGGVHSCSQPLEIRSGCHYALAFTTAFHAYVTEASPHAHTHARTPARPHARMHAQAADARAYPRHPGRGCCTCQ